MLSVLVSSIIIWKPGLARIYNKKDHANGGNMLKRVSMQRNLSIEKSFQTSLAAGVDHVQPHDTVCQVLDVHLWALCSKNMLGARREQQKDTAKEVQWLTQLITIPPNKTMKKILRPSNKVVITTNLCCLKPRHCMKRWPKRRKQT